MTTPTGEPLQRVDTPDPDTPAPLAPAPITAALDTAIVSEERPHPLTPIVQVWVWLVGIAVFVGRQLLEAPSDLSPLDPGRFPWWLAVMVVFALASIGRNLWNWWTTRFVATASELRVEHKGVEHESKRIAYSRIQSVDITQRFAARLLGMAELTIDVGGGAPVRLQYLSRTRAVELRDFLLTRAHGREPGQPAETSAWDDRGGDDVVLLRVPPRELLLGAALSHDLLALLLLAAVPLGIGLALGQPLLVGGGVLPLVFTIGGFLSHRVIGQYNYTLATSPTGMRITRGLTSLSSETVPVNRVQAIKISEPVLWRLTGRARVDLSYLGKQQLTTDEDQAGASSIMLPIGRPDDVRIAVDAVWPGVDVDAIPLRPAPAAARWLVPLSWPWVGYGWDDRVLVFRRGWWTRTTWVLPHARLQSVRAATGPLRRRLGVATIEVHTSELTGTATTFMTDEQASHFLFEELDRARGDRFAEGRETGTGGPDDSLGFPS